MATQKTVKSNNAKGKASSGFTAEERAAMKERARELKAEALKADGGEHGAREDRRDAETGSRHGRTAP